MKRKNQQIDTTKMVQNPFTINLVIPATELTDYGKFIPDEDGINLPATSLIEKMEYTKIFYTAGVRDRIYILKPGSKCLYLYIMYNLQTNVQYVEINIERYMQKNEIKSINTYKDAIKELIRENFIAQSPDYKNVFWINPAIFFNGNRINTFSNNVVIKGKLSRH